MTPAAGGTAAHFSEASMNPIFYAFAFLLFIAVVLGIEGFISGGTVITGPPRDASISAFARCRPVRMRTASASPSSRSAC